MSDISRRFFLQASALGLSSLLAPAVISRSVDEWPSMHHFCAGRFLHGVASGDPLANSVIIWTRISSPCWSKQSEFYAWHHDVRGRSHKKLVGWQVALDPDFKYLVRRGKAFVTKKTDYTLKVDLDELTPNTTYYYRFRSAGEWSAIGTTKTLPTGDISQVKLAVMSCSNYPAGYFNAYQDASLISDLDAVVHLGDYIYEYGVGGYATANAAAIGRSFEGSNDTELLTLKDYRRRYAQYRSDTGLQALHSAAPFICVWDDHEVANDTWKEGAENHSEGEGEFNTRKFKALQAYFEWMPIRPVVENNREIIYRQFEFGNLVNLMMLDTRIVGRDEQLNYANYSDQSGSFDANQFIVDVSDPNRTLLGVEQRNWLQATMASSSAKWQVLGQQVLMGRMDLPAELLLNLSNPSAALTAFSELITIKERVLGGDTTVTAEEKARIKNSLPYNLDAWDGYAAERELILSTSLALGKNLVVLAGDTHNAWANNLSTFQGQQAGVEFATSSVTSPGLEDYLQLPSRFWPKTEAGFELLIDNLKYMNIGDRGYLTVTFSETESKADWVYVDNIASTDYNTLPDRARSAKVNDGENKLTLF